MADDKVWYLNTAEGQQGPYSAEELRGWLGAGQITSEWYVWREGLADWKQIADTPELAAPPAAAAPPPAPAPAVKKTEEPKPKPEPAVVKSQEKPKSRILRTVGISLAVLLLLVGGAVGYLLYFEPALVDSLLVEFGVVPPPPPPEPPPPPKKIEPKVPTREEVLTGYYESIKDRGADFTSPNAVFEQLWIVELEKKFPDAAIVTGLVFEKKKKQAGRLDIVVFDSDAEKVLYIAHLEPATDSEDAVDAVFALADSFETGLEKKEISAIYHESDKKNKWPFERFDEDFEIEIVGASDYQSAEFDTGVDISREEAELILKWIRDGGPSEGGEDSAESDADAEAADAEGGEAGAGEEPSPETGEETAAGKKETSLLPDRRTIRAFV